MFDWRFAAVLGGFVLLAVLFSIYQSTRPMRDPYQPTLRIRLSRWWRERLTTPRLKGLPFEPATLVVAVGEHVEWIDVPPSDVVVSVPTEPPLLGMKDKFGDFVPVQRTTDGRLVPTGVVAEPPPANALLRVVAVFHS